MDLDMQHGVGILHVYVHATGHEKGHAACLSSSPRCIFMSLLHYRFHAACSCPCCMILPMLHLHVHAACLYLCCMFISMLHVPVHTAVHVHAACSCLCCISMFINVHMLVPVSMSKFSMGTDMRSEHDHAAWTWSAAWKCSSMDGGQVNVACPGSSPCCMFKSALLVMSMLHVLVQAACSCSCRMPMSIICTYPCQCCMFMSIYHGNGNVARMWTCNMDV